MREEIHDHTIQRPINILGLYTHLYVVNTTSFAAWIFLTVTFKSSRRGFYNFKLTFFKKRTDKPIIKTHYDLFTKGMNTAGNLSVS